MQRISDKQAAMAKTARDQLIKEAGRCENREQLEDAAVRILSGFADSPGMIHRICESFNSGKSVYKLASGNDQTRPEDFAIIDNIDRVVNRVKAQATTKEMTKCASFAPRFSVISATSPIIKEAAAVTVKTPAQYLEMDFRPAMLPVTLNNVLTHQGEMINKLAFAWDRAKINRAAALDKLTRSAAHLSKSAKANVYAIGSAYYKDLFDVAADIFKTDLPIRKFAAAPQCPGTPIFNDLSNLMEKAYIADNYQQLLKTAAADLCGDIRKLANAYRLHRLIKKQAAGLNDMLTGALAGSVLPEAFGLKGESKSDIYSGLRTPNVENVLRELEMKRNFYEVYADDYISSFPIEQVQDAYNTAIQKLPDKLKAHPSSATQLIRSWVTKTLSHGGVVSAEDASDVMEAADKLKYETGIVGNPFRD